MKHAFIALCLAWLGIAAAEPINDLSGGQTGRIEYKSSNPAHRWALLRDQRDTPEIVVSGDLLMPSSLSGKVPAAIFSHGSEGAKPHYYDLWAKRLNDAGIAVFVIDSFTARGIENTRGEKQLNHNLTGSIADALYALKLLATHPQIDSTRIYHVGWSLGGTTVLSAAFPAYVRNIAPDGLTWAGSVALYPGCNVRYRVDHLGVNPNPLLLLLGEADDNTPASACVKFAQQLSADGNKVSFKVYAGAYHDFDRPDLRWVKLRHGIFDECDIEVKLSAQPRTFGEGMDMKARTPIHTGDELQKRVQMCGAVKFVTMETNRDAQKQAIADVIGFIGSSRLQ